MGACSASAAPDANIKTGYFRFQHPYLTDHWHRPGPPVAERQFAKSSRNGFGPLAREAADKRRAGLETNNLPAHMRFVA